MKRNYRNSQNVPIEIHLYNKLGKKNPLPYQKGETLLCKLLLLISTTGDLLLQNKDSRDALKAALKEMIEFSLQGFHS